jgi:hypothetical protein
MIRTLAILDSVNDVPLTWTFEHYLGLSEKLDGQDVKIKSVFNPKDNDPSFYIYVSRKTDKYRYKDFSTGKEGDAIELIRELFQLPGRPDAAQKIVNDYNEYILSGGKHTIVDFKVRERYKVDSVHTRQWSNFDEKFWMSFKINSKLLGKYNVKPLSHYILKKEGFERELTIEGNFIYGYFKEDGTCYKIYQPMTRDKKFIKISDYTQGAQQLKYDVPYLAILSSLKDGMCFERLGFKNIEFIAVDSENVTLSPKIIEKLKTKYKAICTIFDNDEPGIKAMLRYKEKYNLPGAHLKVEDDLARCVEVHGIRNTQEWMYPILTKALTGTLKELP